jgi:hypothetical protein
MHEYDYQTVGDTVLMFVLKQLNAPLPPVSEVGWGQSREENSPPSHTLKFGPAIERRQGKLVQKMKAHASESGQMHAQHPGVCGQVIKKRCTVSRPKMKIQGLSKQLPIFCCKGTDQHVRVPIPEKSLNFRLNYSRMTVQLKIYFSW